MQHFHTRVISLTYSADEVPEFKTTKERKAWYEALGYLVAYGLHGPDNEPSDHSMDLVTMYLGKTPSIDACYRNPVLQERYEDDSCRYLGTPDHDLDKLKSVLSYGSRSFTLGAVLGEDGKWGFHS